MPTIHARTAIRNAFVSEVTGLASTGSRVHGGRMYPPNETGLPCWLVRTTDEDVAGDPGNGQERQLDVLLSGYAMDKGDIDAVLNQLALEAETALAGGDRTFGGKVAGYTLISVSSGTDDSLQKPCGRIDLTYRVTYFTTTGNPGVTS